MVSGSQKRNSEGDGRIKDIKLIEDGGSPTGYTVVVGYTDDGVGVFERKTEGIPASPFEVIMWRKLVAAERKLIIAEERVRQLESIEHVKVVANLPPSV